MPSLRDRYPREYERYRSIDHNRFPTFKSYLQHKGLQVRFAPLPPRPVGFQWQSSHIINAPIDSSLWPQGTVRQIEFEETPEYRREVRWIYSPSVQQPEPNTMMWEDWVQRPPPPIG